MSIVSTQFRMSNQLWLGIVTAVLFLFVVLHGNAFASGAVIVAHQQNIEDIAAATPLINSAAVAAKSSNSSFQIVVKDYAEDDNRLMIGGSSNGTEKSLPTTTKSPSESTVYYLHKQFIYMVGLFTG